MIEKILSCVLQTWQRPTLPRLETKYHWRWGVSRPCSEWERVQPPRDNHQVGKTQHMIHAFRMDHMIACLLVYLILFACRSQGTPIGHTVTSHMRQRLIQAITDHVFTWKLLFREAGEPKLYLIYTSFCDRSVCLPCSRSSVAAIQTRGRRALWRGPSGALRASGQNRSSSFA